MRMRRADWSRKLKTTQNTLPSSMRGHPQACWMPCEETWLQEECIYGWGLMTVWLRIFLLHCGAKAICIRKQPYFKCWIWFFSWLAIRGVILTGDAGVRQRAAAPGQPCDPQGQEPIRLTIHLSPYNHSIVHFWYRIQQITGDIQHHYKIGFV